MSQMVPLNPAENSIVSLAEDGSFYLYLGGKCLLCNKPYAKIRNLDPVLLIEVPCKGGEHFRLSPYIDKENKRVVVHFTSRKDFIHQLTDTEYNELIARLTLAKMES